MTSKGMHQVRNLLDFSKDEKQTFLDSFDVMMTDCDGVIWNLLGSIPDTGKALNDVEAAGKKVIYVSNNSVRSDAQYEMKINEIGATYRKENIVHPILSTIWYLKKINFQGLIYFVGTTVAKDRLLAEGFNIVDGPYGAIKEELGELVKAAKDNLPVKCVIVDFDFFYSYPQMLRAELYLRDPECQFIVGCCIEPRFPIMPGFELIGPSFFYKALAETLAPEKKPIIFGKPGEDLGKMLKEKYGVVDPKRVLFVGDLPNSDVKFAKSCGFQSLLVLTGGTSREEMLRYEDNDVVPDFYADSITALSTLIHSLPSETRL
uniref:Putative pyridoxal phosphate phosphatase n=1 Tax=Nyssomyia neivai TaxID=330878 RepID=A0A1L8DZA8_9DIPT